MSDTRIAGNHGFKVALPGYNAMTATPEQSAVHSGFLSPKIDATKGPSGGNANPHYGHFSILFGSVIPDNTDQLILSIAHGYSYTPSVSGTVTINIDPGVAVPLPSAYGNAGLDGIGPGGVNVFLSIFVRTTPTTCDFLYTYNSANNPLIPPTLAGVIATISFYIFAENGA